MVMQYYANICCCFFFFFFCFFFVVVVFLFFCVFFFWGGGVQICYSSLFTEYDVARGILKFQCKTWEFRDTSCLVTGN